MATSCDAADASAALGAETRMWAPIRASQSAWVPMTTSPCWCSSWKAWAARLGTVRENSRVTSSRAARAEAAAGVTSRSRLTATPARRRRPSGELKGIRVLFHDLLKGVVLLLVEGQQLPPEAGVEAVAVDPGPALGDGGVEEEELLAVAHHQRRARLLDPGLRHPGQRFDRA